MNFLARWKFPLLVSIILSVLYVQYFGNRAFVDLDIKVSKTTWFKIYWAAPGKLFSEENMVRMRVRPEQEHYRFFLTNLRKVEKLRIDPHQYEGVSVIKKLLITQSGIEPVLFEKESDFKQLKPLFQIIHSEHKEEGFYVFSSGGDPNFEYLLNVHGNTPFLHELIRIAAIFSIVFLFFYLTGSVREDYRFIPLLFASVFTLVLIMASISAEEVHPDEYVHLDASHYYMSNWLPPVVDDPSIRHTYSVYGVSRLNKPEVSYFFTGKLAQILTPLKLPYYLSLRMFNIMLFGGILLYIIRRREALMVAVPFLLSPQLWYVFSYCNSDAFALFVTFMVSCQVVIPDSMLNTFLKGERSLAWIGRLLLMAILCSLLFLLKKNYFFFILFVFGYFVWKNVLAEYQWDRTKFFKRIAVVVLIAMGLVGLRVGADYAVNGLDRKAKINRLRAEIADPLFNPNTPLEKKHFYLYRKARGDSLKTLVVTEKWFGKTFRSAFGLYGYFTITATDAYYYFLRAVGLGFLGFFILFILLRAPGAEKLLLFMFLGCAVGLIGISLWHSWTADFQTQGRYLFPIIPMLGILLYHTRRYIPDAGFRLFLVSMFALSFYSFVYVGLLYIPKAALASLVWIPSN